MKSMPRVPRIKTISPMAIIECLWFFITLSIYSILYVVLGLGGCFAVVCRRFYAAIDRTFFSICDYGRRDPVESIWSQRAETQAASFEKMFLSRLSTPGFKRCIFNLGDCKSSRYEFIAGEFMAYSMVRVGTSNYWDITITVKDAYYALKNKAVRHEIIHAIEFTATIRADMSYMDEQATPPLVMTYTNPNVMALYKGQLEQYIKDINNPVFREMLVKAKT